MTDSEPQTFELGNLPLRKPVLLRKAVPHLPGEAMTRLSGEGQPVDAQRALEAAVAAGVVGSARAKVPGVGIQTFVEGESLSTGFEEFVKRVLSGELPRPAAPTPPRLGRRMRRLAREALGIPTVLRLAERLCVRHEHFVRLAMKSPFAPVQIESEICGLLELVAVRQPRRILEIGTARGGTLYLLSRATHPEALLVSVDISERNYRADLLRSFARDRQRIELLVGDSTAESTRAESRRLFPDGVDLLFLDGDHSYEGISRDFELYWRLVQPGGMIVFHDIVEDNRTRHGIDTGGWTGGVPRFWAEVKQRHRYREFVRDWAQDGLGIGVIFVAGP